MSLLECRGVGIRHGETVLFSDVELRLEPGQALGIVGPSGAGKTSLLRLLNRLDDPSAGTLLLGGRAYAELDPMALRREVALVPQRPVLFEGTVADNLGRWPAGGPRPERTAMQAELEQLGLAAEVLERDARSLSGGEQQRVALARALLGGPRVLALDEPTSALDPGHAAALATRLGRARDSGLALVVVTHQQSFVSRLTIAVGLLAAGKLELQPDPAALQRFFDGNAASPPASAP